MFVLKHPDPYTLASVSYQEVAPDSTWIAMSESDFSSWMTEQIASGWTAKLPSDDVRKIWSSSAAFWSNFTDQEKLAILASTVGGIILLREELRLWTGEVWSDDAKVQAGLSGLVAVGILTEERKQAILTP